MTKLSSISVVNKRNHLFSKIVWVFTSRMYASSSSVSFAFFSISVASMELISSGFFTIFTNQNNWPKDDNVPTYDHPTRIMVLKPLMLVRIIHIQDEIIVDYINSGCIVVTDSFLFSE